MRMAWVMAGIGVMVGTVNAAPWPLPPIDGHFSGEFVPPGAGSPVIDWQVSVKSPGAGQRTLAFGADAVDGSLAVAARGSVEPSRAATWQLDVARVELSAWLPALRALIPAWPAGLAVTGAVQGSGAGQWLADAAQPEGDVRFEAEDIEADWSELPLSLRGGALRGSFALVPGVASAELTADAGTVAGWDWATLASTFSWEMSNGWFSVQRLEVHGAGGMLEVAPFRFDPAAPTLDLQLTFVGVQLETFARLLPDVVAEARGEVSGDVHLTWSESDGLAIKGGRIALLESSNAQMRLRPTPGLITNQLPPDSPAFVPLQRVELGKTPLAVRALRLALEPADDPLGRSAVLRLEAEPLDPGIKAPIIIDVNVSGPLNQLIKLGMDERVKFGQ